QARERLPALKAPRRAPDAYARMLETIPPSSCGSPPYNIQLGSLDPSVLLQKQLQVGSEFLSECHRLMRERGADHAPAPLERPPFERLPAMVVRAQTARIQIPAERCPRDRPARYTPAAR